MDSKEKIARLEGFKVLIEAWRSKRDDAVRTEINKEKMWVRREVIEARCFQSLTIGPPPAIGGLVMRNVDPFAMMFEPPYGLNLMRTVIDMVDQTIGALAAGPEQQVTVVAKVEVEPQVQKGYVFIAMPIDPSDKSFDDVLDSIKEAAHNCGLQAERVDEPHSNERITDRILESIQKAEYVVVDLTNARPNVFYEAGYAHALGKIPIYIAKQGTKLEFDLKDYPVIFFNSMRELKAGLDARLRGLAAAAARE